MNTTATKILAFLATNTGATRGTLAATSIVLGAGTPRSSTYRAIKTLVDGGLVALTSRPSLPRGYWITPAGIRCQHAAEDLARAERWAREGDAMSEGIEGVRRRSSERRARYWEARRQTNPALPVAFATMCATFMLWASVGQVVAPASPDAVSREIRIANHIDDETPLGVGWDGVNSKQYQRTGRGFGWQS